MKGTTKIRLKMDVLVDVVFDVDPKSREANILSARIFENDNPVTPRKVYGAMASGDYNSLDTAAITLVTSEFERRALEHANKSRREYPDGEIRSIPMVVEKCLAIISRVKHIGVPPTLVKQALGSLDVRLEPVLCKTPVLYVWPCRPGGRSKPGKAIRAEGGDIVIDEDKMNQIKSATKAVSMERMEDGSYRMTWRG